VIVLRELLMHMGEHQTGCPAGSRAGHCLRQTQGQRWHQGHGATLRVVSGLGPDGMRRREVPRRGACQLLHEEVRSSGGCRTSGPRVRYHI